MSKKILTTEPADHISVFQEKTISRTWHNDKWWFAAVGGFNGAPFNSRIRPDKTIRPFV